MDDVIYTKKDLELTKSLICVYTFFGIAVNVLTIFLYERVLGTPFVENFYLYIPVAILSIFILIAVYHAFSSLHRMPEMEKARDPSKASELKSKRTTYWESMMASLAFNNFIVLLSVVLLGFYFFATFTTIVNYAFTMVFTPFVLFFIYAQKLETK